MAAPKRVLLGRIGPAHGIKGEVVITSFTDCPEDIASYGPLMDESERRTFDIRVIRVTAKGVIAQIAGIRDRNAAETLRGTDLYVARQRLPATEADAFYHADLIGLEAFSPDGQRIGRIVAVENYGAGDLLEIRLEGTAGGELVPFADAFVPEIDLANGRAVIILPPAVDDDDDDTGPGGGSA